VSRLLLKAEVGKVEKNAFLIFFFFETPRVRFFYFLEMKRKGAGEKKNISFPSSASDKCLFSDLKEKKTEKQK
jgi:hypothetical protein